MWKFGQYLHAVVLPRFIVVSWYSFLIFSFCASIAVGFHELPMSEKSNNLSELCIHPQDSVIN